MPLKISETKVQPVKASADHKIVVYVTYHENSRPFVFAHIEGDGVDPYIADHARLVEKYSFEITNPFVNTKVGKHER